MNGELVRLAGGGVSCERDFAPTGRVMIDGESAVAEAAMRERRLLGSRGLLHVVWNADPDGFVAGEVEIVARGVLAEEALPWLRTEVRGKVRALLAEMEPELRRSPPSCRP